MPSTSRAFEAQIADFEAADRIQMPPRSGIVFTGSSSIAGWPQLAGDFPHVPVIQRGFGASTIPDCTYYSHRIVTPYQPRTVVLYAGDNDIAAGATPEQVQGAFQGFVGAVRKKLPEAKIVYISIKPSPSRWALHEKVEQANQLIRDEAAKETNISFVDIYPLMLGPDGLPRPELYVGDRLHLSSEGYALWRSTLAPYLAAE